MKSISDYKKRVSRYGGLKGAIESHSIHSLNFFFKDSPSYEEVYINGSDEVTGVQITTDTKVPTIKYILMKPNENIRTGDMVYRTKLEAGHWICTGHDPNAIYQKGFIEKCNSELKWVDENGQIQSFPCVFYYGTKANFGTYFDKVMTLPDGRRQVVVQKNEHTLKIKRNVRFMFGDNVFSVIDHDHISDEGLVNLNLKDDQFNAATDNKELGIANYYGHVANYRIKILNGESISIEQTQELQINIEVTNNNTIIENPKVQYEVDDKSVALIDENGMLTPVKKGSVIVSVLFNGAIASINVNIIESMVNNYTADIIGDDEIKQEMSKSYVAIFKNNGVSFSETALFSLTDEKDLPTTLAKIHTQSNDSCIIRAGSKTGRVKLHVQNPNGLIKSSKIIQIKTLI